MKFNSFSLQFTLKLFLVIDLYFLHFINPLTNKKNPDNNSFPCSGCAFSSCFSWTKNSSWISNFFAIFNLLFNSSRYQLKEHLLSYTVCTAVGYLERCGCLKQINLTFKGCFYLSSYWYANNYLTYISNKFSFVYFLNFWIYENVECWTKKEKPIRYYKFTIYATTYYFKDIRICRTNMWVFVFMFYV